MAIKFGGRSAYFLAYLVQIWQSCTVASVGASACTRMHLVVIFKSALHAYIHLLEWELSPDVRASWGCGNWEALCPHNPRHVGAYTVLGAGVRDCGACIRLCVCVCVCVCVFPL